MSGEREGVPQKLHEASPPAQTQVLRPLQVRVVSCRVVSCRVVSCRVVSCRVVSCRVVSCRVVSCRVVSCRVVSCRVVSCRVVSCRVVSCRVVSCRVVSCRVVSCRVVSCRVVSCRVVSCRVVSCRVVSCRVVSCRVVSCRVVSCRVVILTRFIRLTFHLPLLLPVTFVFHALTCHQFLTHSLYLFFLLSTLMGNSVSHAPMRETVFLLMVCLYKTLPFNLLVWPSFFSALTNLTVDKVLFITAMKCPFSDYVAVSEETQQRRLFWNCSASLH